MGVSFDSFINSISMEFLSLTYQFSPYLFPKYLLTTFNIHNYTSAFSSEKPESLSKFNIVELDVSVHVVASSVKKFLKRLPTPLVPHEFHDLLLAAVGT